jgi:hypothetical protein
MQHEDRHHPSHHDPSHGHPSHVHPAADRPDADRRNTDRPDGGPPAPPGLPPGEVPVLPPPSLWRLIVAGIVIVGFLWFLYDYQRDIEEEAAGQAIEQPPAAR